jgi:hypothetical protein
MRRKLDLVEKAMAEVGWSPRLAGQLADQLGVSKRTVYQYRTMVLEDIAEASQSEDPRHDRAEFLSRLRGYQAKAARTGSFGSLASLMNAEAAARSRRGGAAPDPGAVSDSDALADLSGSAALRAELGEVAKLRAMATADRSYVAAEKFLRTERELRSSIRDVRAREEAEATDSEDALLTELREALGGLPDSLLMRALATVRVDVLEHAAAAAGVAPTTTH